MCEPVNSPICKKWSDLGGESVLGASDGMPELVLDAQATLQRFEKGVIFLTNAYGAVRLSKLIFDEWQTLTSRPSLPGNSDNLQKYLGSPLQDSFAVAQGGDVAYFERGMMYVKKDKPGEFDDSRNCVVYGWVYDRYKTLGDINSSLGLPRMSTYIDSTGGLVSWFDGGGIYWLDGVGGGVVANGPIYSRWQALSGLAGELGYPITDEQPVVKDGQEIGRVSRFQNGAIFLNQQAKAFDVRGPILTAWEDQFGGVAGEFGFPISGQRKAPKSNKIFNDFEGGIIVWDNDAAPPKQLLAVRQLEFFVTRFAGTGGDEIGSSGLEIYVPYTVASNSAGIISQGTLQDGDDFYPAEATVNLNFPIPGVVNGKTVVAIDFEGKDHDNVGEDGTLGRIKEYENGVEKGHYDIDNGWQLNLGIVLFENDAFHMNAGMRRPGVPLDPDPEKFRGQGFWSFKNFKTDDLSTKQYADTFRDIDDGTLITLNPSTWLNEAWETIFYHVAYNDMAEAGNCFGMCVESIYGQVGRSFFNEPLFKYTNNEPGLLNEINLKHGYQCGASVIDWFVGQFITMNTHDPVGVFENTMEAYNRGDYPVISMSNGYFKAGGHVVRPYDWSKPSGDHWIISVANPNFPAPGGTPADKVRPNDAEGCVIHIYPDVNALTSTFSFENAAGDVWEGGQWSGGRMHYIPYSQLSDEPRTPGYEVLALLAGGLIVILGSAGESKQISDQAGNTFYEPDLQGAPTRWQEIRRDGDTLLGNVARMPMFSDGDGNGAFPEIYFVRGTGATLQHRIAPRTETPPDEPYHWLMRSPTLSAAIALQAASAVEDAVTLERTGTFDQAITLSMSPGNSNRKAELWLEGWRGLDGKNGKWFHLHDLSLAPGQVIHMRLNEAGSELVLKNGGPELKCNVSVKDSNTQEVLLESGKTTRIRPDWDHPDQPWVVEEAHDSLRHFMESRGLPPQQGIRAYFPSAESVRELIQA
jgi:hypothetical protein